MSTSLCRIGIFYDGNYFFHVSNYYNYAHALRRRISVAGLHRFVRTYVGEQEGVDPDYCKITEGHYFRGRLSYYEAESSKTLIAERLFDDILVNEGILAHYLPVRIVDGRREEKGVDIWLALEAYELAVRGKFDVMALVAGDGDYTPLAKKLTALGIPVMVLAWNFQYTDSRSGKPQTTFTSSELLKEAVYSVDMGELVDDKSQWDRYGIDELFVPKSQMRDGGEEAGQEDDFRRSVIVSLQEGYGFIARASGNLFFHWSDVAGGVFSELRVGDTVQYKLSQNEKGQEVAVQVKRVEETPS
jgi:cold shock CspA family protein/uncharacterized LabA/DUF88 family protein